jgi:hypothetical protein
VKEAVSLYQTILNDASFYRVLLKCHEDLAEQARRTGCACGEGCTVRVNPRKPREFVPSIYMAKASDYVTATQRVYVSPSHIVLPVAGN